MGKTGMCWDNALAESFFATYKLELIEPATWPTRARARRNPVAERGAERGADREGQPRSGPTCDAGSGGRGAGVPASPTAPGYFRPTGSLAC